MPNDNFLTEKAQELDALFCNHVPMSQIAEFFARNQEDLTDIFRRIVCRNYLFFPDLIAGLDKQHIREICKFLDGRYQSEYNTNMMSIGPIIMSKWIAAEKRALFWNVMVGLNWPWSGLPGKIFAQDVFIDNDCARRCFLYNTKQSPKHDFLKNTELSKKDFEGANELIHGIRQDSVSLFEMHRQMAGRIITITMLLYLLRYDAVKCFLHLLAHFPKKVYKCRSAEEWLFTVCRNCPPETAVPIMQWIEEDRPGIVAKSRDPWGNTLLWNTCANRNHSIEKIQNVLLEQGCDPTVENQWGLSFRIIKENTI